MAKPRNRNHVFTIDLETRQTESRLSKLANKFAKELGQKRGRARKAYLLRLIAREYEREFPELTASQIEEARTSHAMNEEGGG